MATGEQTPIEIDGKDWLASIEERRQRVGQGLGKHITSNGVIADGSNFEHLAHAANVQSYEATRQHAADTLAHIDEVLGAA